MSSGEYLFLIIALLIFIIILGLKYGKGGEEHGEKKLLDFFRKKRHNKRLEQELEKLEAKVLEADIRLSGFALFEERLIYKMLKEAQRLERKRRREVKRYVV